MEFVTDTECCFFVARLFVLVFFSRTEVPIFIGIMGVGLFMATIYTTALALGTEKIRGNDLGVSNMVLIGSFGGIITPALVRALGFSKTTIWLNLPVHWP